MRVNNSSCARRLVARIATAIGLTAAVVSVSSAPARAGMARIIKFDAYTGLSLAPAASFAACSGVPAADTADCSSSGGCTCYTGTGGLEHAGEFKTATFNLAVSNTVTTNSLGEQCAPFVGQVIFGGKQIVDLDAAGRYCILPDGTVEGRGQAVPTEFVERDGKTASVAGELTFSFAAPPPNSTTASSVAGFAQPLIPANRAKYGASSVDQELTEFALDIYLNWLPH